MNDKKYFNRALSSLAKDTAYAAAVRHLHDAGLSVSEIKRQLDYPASDRQIEAVIAEYEQEKADEDSAYTYVQDVNELGRRSFRRVKKELK